MKKQEIEFKVLNIIERVENCQPIEDNEVELKTRWPEDHFKAARRIAAHANSARGETIMWLIGIDEKKGVVGADFKELSNWYAKVRSRFDQLVAPNLISLSVPYKGKTVVALVFETDRAPYVIRIPNSHTGPVTHEVPWREANSTRSARRSDLLKMLYPINQKPEIELIDGVIELQKAINSDKAGQYQWSLNLQVYIVNRASDIVVFPFHKCRIFCRPLGSPDEKAFSNIKITPPVSYSSREFKEKSQSLTVSATENEVLINTAGMAYITADCISGDPVSGKLIEEIEVKVLLRTHISNDPITLVTTFKLSDETKCSERLVGQWRPVIEKQVL